MSSCNHTWVIHPDQDDTGTHGVRKFCDRCKQTLTFYETFDLVEAAHE